MLKKTLITIGLLVSIVGVIAFIKYSQIQAMIAMGESMGMPPIAVGTTSYEQQEWTPKIQAVGTTKPVQGAILSAELPGIVKNIHFQSGSDITKGNPIIDLDTSSEKAQLVAAEAVFKLASSEHQRSLKLLNQKTISQAEFDKMDAEYKQALGQVQNLNSIISKKSLVAPFSGKLGIRKVQLGEYLNAGSPIVSLQTVAPIYVSFHLPQKDLSKIKVGYAVKVSSDATQGKTYEGQVTAIAAEVNSKTRMFEVQATFSNTDATLVPGMFLNVNVLQPEKRKVSVVPVTAVLYASYGNSVYTVEKAKGGKGMMAQQKFVRLGEKRGDYVEILDGIGPEDRIVHAGAYKLFPGAPVNIQDDKAIAPKANPSLKDS